MHHSKLHENVGPLTGILFANAKKGKYNCFGVYLEPDLDHIQRVSVQLFWSTPEGDYRVHIRTNEPDQEGLI